MKCATAVPLSPNTSARGSMGASNERAREAEEQLAQEADAAASEAKAAAGGEASTLLNFSATFIEQKAGSHLHSS